ncbi:MAG TPA: ATP-binding cassette domain-containing protein [Ilumatobacteraceae bacterium]
MSTPAAPPTLRLDHVSFVRDGRRILDDITWTVLAGQRWLILGANGSGKTTLVRIASMYEHPSAGTVSVLGETLGSTDVRVLRRRIGVMSAAIGAQLRPALSAQDVVVTAKFAALEPWWHTYTDDDYGRARECLTRMGVGQFVERSLGTLSSGEQQRVLLARALMNEPGLVVLDEPSARLDLGGREQLVGALTELVADAAAPPLLLVTHHVDEVPPGMTHAMLLREGTILRAGPIDDVLSAEALSECFGMPLALERRADGRLTAWSRPPT